VRNVLRRQEEFTYTVKAPGRLVSAEEFDNIIIRQTAGGGELRLKDVGRAELGSENYRSFGRAIVKDSATGNWTGGAAASLLVYLLPGANQLASAEGVYHSLEEFSTFFPTDVAYKIVYDTTPSVEASIHEILKTLVEAFILVSLVVFVFLQSFRATIIPLITVPVALGTFIFSAARFSINTSNIRQSVTGDDAIVVVARYHFNGKTPRLRSRP
jgi:HAE1 family hydrophobic/amphiphilic exporter-1